jgi:hypothetical protein
MRASSWVAAYGPLRRPPHNDIEHLLRIHLAPVIAHLLAHGEGAFGFRPRRLQLPSPCGRGAGGEGGVGEGQMRLRERDGAQSISLNPFGSYYGKQFDYSHLGGNGNGRVFMQVFSGALQPNGPSFNGETLRFSLLLAPYTGDEPPQELQNDAAAHFYPPGVILHSAPKEIGAETNDDIQRFIISERRRAQLNVNMPPNPPTAFLVNPSPNAVDLVWEAQRDGRPPPFDERGWRC